MKYDVDKFMLLRDYSIKVIALRDDALRGTTDTLASRVKSASNKVDTTNVKVFTDLTGDSKLTEICNRISAARTNLQFNKAASDLEDHYYYTLKTYNK